MCWRSCLRALAEVRASLLSLKTSSFISAFVCRGLTMTARSRSFHLTASLSSCPTGSTLTSSRSSGSSPSLRDTHTAGSSTWSRSADDSLLEHDDDDDDDDAGDGDDDDDDDDAGDDDDDAGDGDDDALVMTIILVAVVLICYLLLFLICMKLLVLFTVAQWLRCWIMAQLPLVATWVIGDVRKIMLLCVSQWTLDCLQIYLCVFCCCNVQQASVFSVCCTLQIRHLIWFDLTVPMDI